MIAWVIGWKRKFVDHTWRNRRVLPTPKGQQQNISRIRLAKLTIQTTYAHHIHKDVHITSHIKIKWKKEKWKWNHTTGFQISTLYLFTHGNIFDDLFICIYDVSYPIHVRVCVCVWVLDTFFCTLINIALVRKFANQRNHFWYEPFP